MTAIRTNNKQVQSVPVIATYWHRPCGDMMPAMRITYVQKSVYPEQQEESFLQWRIHVMSANMATETGMSYDSCRFIVAQSINKIILEDAYRAVPKRA